MQAFLCLEHLWRFTRDGYKSSLCLEHLCHTPWMERCGSYVWP